MTKFSIKIHMADGRETLRFSNLGQVARYLKARDLGSDYRRPGYLQAEMGQYLFNGFDWKDILDGSPYESRTRYKAELINSVRLACRRTVSRLSPRPWWKVSDGPETVALIDYYPSDGPNDKPFHPILMDTGRRSGPATVTMEESRDWLTAQYLAAVCVEERAVETVGCE